MDYSIFSFFLKKKSENGLELNIATEYNLELLEILLPKHYGIIDVQHTQIMWTSRRASETELHPQSMDALLTDH